MQSTCSGSPRVYIMRIMGHRSAVALLLSLVAVACGGGIPRLLLTSHALPLADVPEALRSNVEKWRSLNPTFRFEYFDDAAQAAFMASSCAAPRCAEAYGALRSGAGRADLFRVAFLYYRGGWWFDADLKPGDVAASCGLEAAEDLGLFVVREPKHGHVRFMVLGGAGHPLLYATLRTQIANVFEARALPPAKRPRTLHVTGPFTLGRTLCDPFRHAPMADALERGFDAAAVDAAAADVAANCDRGAFRGRRAVLGGDDAAKEKASADWADTYGAGSPLAFRFDGCRGAWHRPGSPMSYADVLAAMNVTHHLKTTAT